jgi:putative transposase
VKYAFVQDCRTWSGLSLNRLLPLIDVSPSGYYDWLKREPSKRETENRELDDHISRVYHEHRGRYGYRRIYVELLEQGVFFGSRERIRRRLRHLGLKAIHKQKFKNTTDSNHDKLVAPNLLQQNFTMTRLDEAWVGDITYIRVGQKWLYLAVVIDLYSRKVIGWSMDKRMKADLVCDALKMALHNRNDPKGVMMHTDRGSQYCSKRYQRLIKNQALLCSMSGKGNCYDNAVCESFFHTLKVELVYQRRYETREQAKRSIFWYIEAYYNRVRRHSGINYKSPIDFENQVRNAA